MARTNRITRGLVAGLATITLLVGAPVAASAKDSTDIDALAAEMEITERAERAQLEQDVKKAARDEGMTESEVVATALAEAREARAASQPEGQEGELTTMSSSGGGCTAVSPPVATRKGDVIYSPSGLAGFTYGHSAIYYGTHALVEAPGPGSNSRWVYRTNTKVCKGSKLQYVRVTQTKRNSAANRAYNNYRGKPYDYQFWSNRTNGTGRINCSELVWRAYRYSSAGISVDINEGNSVYPSDIRDSGYTRTYRTV